MDIQEKLNEEDDDIFLFNISETSPGGIGVITEFVDTYSNDPRNFFRLIESSLKENEFELSDIQLQRILKILSNEETTLASNVYDFRNSNQFSRNQKHLKE